MASRPLAGAKQSIPTALCIGDSGGTGTPRAGRPVLELVDGARYRIHLVPNTNLADALGSLASMMSLYRPGMVVLEEVWHHRRGSVEPDAGGLTAAELEAVLQGSVKRVESMRVDRFLWRVVGRKPDTPVLVEEFQNDDDDSGADGGGPRGGRGRSAGVDGTRSSRDLRLQGFIEPNK